MFKKTRFALCAVALAVGTLAHTAQAQSLSAMVEAARQTDATYLSAVAAAQANRSKADQGRSVRLPTIGMSATASLERTDFESTADTDTDKTSIGFSLTQPLFRMANNAAVAQSDQLELVAGQQLRDADAALVVRVSEAYFNVLVAQDKLQVVKAQKDAVSQQLASAKRNFEVGTATITDTREAQAQFDRMVAAEIASESDLRIKRLALEQITGVANPTPLPLAAKAGLPDLASGTLDQWVNTAMDKSATVAMAQAGLETARLEVSKAEAGHLPTLDLEAGYSAARYDGNCSASTGCSNASIGVKFTLPIFAGFAIQNRVKETLQLEDKARQDLEAARRGVTQGVRQAYLGVQSGLGQVKALEAAEVSSQSALDATKLGYEVGVRINVDVLNAQTNLFQTKADLAKARYDVLLGGLKLRQAAGTLSSDDVALVAKTLQP